MQGTSAVRIETGEWRAGDEPRERRTAEWGKRCIRETRKRGTLVLLHHPPAAEPMARDAFDATPRGSRMNQQEMSHLDVMTLL